MQFGIREICDVVFKAKNAGYLNKAKQKYRYVPGQPVLYIDSAKTSTMEGAATTVYAQGGKGNARLIAWEGERTLTFTVEDALLSEMGFAILSGAELIKAADKSEAVQVHMTATQVVDANGNINLTDALDVQDTINYDAPIFVMTMEDGSFGSMLTGLTNGDGKSLGGANAYAGKTVFVDFYVSRRSGVTEMTIDMENFAGYYYVEASTLFRRQSDGKDLPAELIFPNVKIQSNFTFNMAATGDPSTFTFTMDALPGYTRFDHKKKVLCAMQIVEENATESNDGMDSNITTASDDKQYPIVDASKVHTVTLINNNMVVETYTGVEGDVLYLPRLTAIDDYEFKGWSATGATDTTGAKLTYTVATANATLYAVFADTKAAG